MLHRTALPLSLITQHPLTAQTAQPEPTPPPTADLQQREANLIETAKATPSGFAVATLDDYGNDYTLLVVRTHTRDAERHQFFADQIVITKGTITLVTVGAMHGEHPNNGPGRPGETPGSSIHGGQELALHST